VSNVEISSRRCGATPRARPCCCWCIARTRTSGSPSAPSRKEASWPASSPNGTHRRAGDILIWWPFTSRRTRHRPRALPHARAPAEEHAEWRRATRAAARDALDDLRGAGFERSVVVAQWLPVTRWPGSSTPGPGGGRATRRGRPAAEGRATARGRRALPRVAQHRAPAPAVAGTPDVRVGRPLVHRDGAPVAAASAGGTPSARAANHVWIIERVQAADTYPPAADDLFPDGALAHRLERLVPPDERARWRPWIDVVLAKLGRGLERAPERRDRRWLRSLFLVAYYVPPPVGHGAILRAL